MELVDTAPAVFTRACAGTPLDEEPASMLIVSLLLSRPEAPSELLLHLLIDLDKAVDGLFEMHQLFDGPGGSPMRLEDRRAFEEIAAMLETQAARIRTVLANPSRAQ
jgi:hypothetical protein